jgi:chromosome segregation ATPase
MSTSPGIMKDNENEIPIQTALDRWAKRAFTAETECDRLLAENAEMAEALESNTKTMNEGTVEINSLRAENAEQDKLILEWGDRYADLSNEADRLRAENAELRDALRAFWMDRLTKEEARALFDKTCPSALEQGFIPWVPSEKQK